MDGHNTIGLIHHVIALFKKKKKKIFIYYMQQLRVKRALPKSFSLSDLPLLHRHLLDSSLVAGQLLIRRRNALAEGGTTEDRGDRTRVKTTPLLILSMGKGKHGSVG